MVEPKLVYVAGPMRTGERKPWWHKRQDFAEKAIDIIQQTGHHPILPIDKVAVDERAYALGINISKDRYLEVDKRLLGECDMMFVVAESEGVRGEMDYARENDIPIYEYIRDIPKVKNYD